MAAILSVANQETRKTDILYEASLSHDQLQKYLSFLVEKGLLEIRTGAGRKFYKITNKGRQFEEFYQRLRQLIAES